MRTHRVLLLALIGATALPSAAHADTQLDPALGGVNLTAGGGYAAWAEPEEDTGWRLVVRAPDGTVSRPDVADFPGPPDPSIGTGGGEGTRPLLAVYSRARGGGSDVYALDLRTGKEHVVSGISAARTDELAPSLENGRLAFVRRGGSRPGVYVWNGRSAARRLSGTVATQTAVNESRVAYATPAGVVVRQASGRGAGVRFATATRPRSIVLGKYRLGWLQGAGQVVQTDRVSVRPSTAHLATQSLPPSTQSIALEGRVISLRLGVDGLQRIDPALSFPGG